jgi:hypothetical protein
VQFYVFAQCLYQGQIYGHGWLWAGDRERVFPLGGEEWKNLQDLLHKSSREGRVASPFHPEWKEGTAMMNEPWGS